MESIVSIKYFVGVNNVMDELKSHIQDFLQTGHGSHLDQAKQIVKRIKSQGVSVNDLYHSVFEQYASLVRQGADAKKLSQVMNIPSRIYTGWGKVVKKKMETIRLPTRESVLPAGVKYQATGRKKMPMEIDDGTQPIPLSVGRGVQNQEGIAWILEVASYSSEMPDEQLQEMTTQVLEIRGPLALPEDFVLIQEEVRFWMEEFINFGPTTSTCEYPSSLATRDMVIFGILKLAQLQAKGSTYGSSYNYRAPHALMKFSQWKQFMSHHFPLTAMVLFKEKPRATSNSQAEEIYARALQMIKQGNYLLITLLERAQILFAGAPGPQLPDFPLPVMSFLTDEDLQQYQQEQQYQQQQQEQEKQQQEQQFLEQIDEFPVVKSIRPQLVGVDPNMPMKCQGNTWNYCRLNYPLHVGDLQAVLGVPRHGPVETRLGQEATVTTAALVNAFFHLLSTSSGGQLLFVNTAAIGELRQGKDAITSMMTASNGTSDLKKIFIPVPLQGATYGRWGLYVINLESKEVRIYDSQAPYTFPHVTPTIMAWIKYKNLGEFKQVVVFQETVEDHVDASGVYMCVFAQIELEVPKSALDFIQLPSTFLSEFITEQILTAMVIPIDSFDLQVE